METIVAAIIGTVGSLGAVLLTAWVTSRINTAKKQAEANTERAESLASSFWLIIDRLRAENANLTTERDILQRRVDDLLEDKSA